MKNAFYFILKALFVLKTSKFLSWLVDQIEKQLDEKDKVNFKIYDTTAWLTKQLQYTYFSISHEVNATIQWNLVS